MVWAHSLFGGGLGHRSHAFLGHGFLLFGLFVYSWEGNVAGGTELLHVLLVHVCCLETACGPSVVAHLFYIWLLRLQTRLLYLLALRVVSYAILAEHFTMQWKSAAGFLVLVLHASGRQLRCCEVQAFMHVKGLA